MSPARRGQSVDKRLRVLRRFSTVTALGSDEVVVWEKDEILGTSDLPEHVNVGGEIAAGVFEVIRG